MRFGKSKSSAALVIVVLVLLGVLALFAISGKAARYELPFKEESATRTIPEQTVTIPEDVSSVGIKFIVSLKDKSGNVVKSWGSSFISIFYKNQEVSYICFSISKPVPYLVKAYMYVLPGRLYTYVLNGTEMCVWLRSVIPNKDGIYIIETFAEAVMPSGVTYATPHLKITLESKKDDKIELPIENPPEVETPEPNTLYMVVVVRADYDYASKGCRCCPGDVYVYVNGTEVASEWCGGEVLVLRPKVSITPGRTYNIKVVSKGNCHPPICDVCERKITIYATADPRLRPPSYHFEGWSTPPTKVIAYYVSGTTLYVKLKILPNYDIEVTDTNGKWGDGETVH